MQLTTKASVGSGQTALWRNKCKDNQGGLKEDQVFLFFFLFLLLHFNFASKSVYTLHRPINVIFLLLLFGSYILKQCPTTVKNFLSALSQKPRLRISAWHFLLLFHLEVRLDQLGQTLLLLPMVLELTKVSSQTYKRWWLDLIELLVNI